MRRLAILGLILATVTALASQAARADIIDLKWNAGAFSHKATLAPKKFLEVCGKLSKGENVAWKFTGGAPTDFNIHYHAGKDVTYPENRKQVGAAEGTLAVAIDQDYCWMWSNKSAVPVEVEVNLNQAKAAK